MTDVTGRSHASSKSGRPIPPALAKVSRVEESKTAAGSSADKYHGWCTEQSPFASSGVGGE